MFFPHEVSLSRKYLMILANNELRGKINVSKQDKFKYMIPIWPWRSLVNIICHLLGLGRIPLLTGHWTAHPDMWWFPQCLIVSVLYGANLPSLVLSARNLKLIGQITILWLHAEAASSFLGKLKATTTNDWINLKSKGYTEVPLSWSLWTF